MRPFLLSLLLVLSLNAYCQEVYHTFLEDGKVWHYTDNDYLLNHKRSFSLIVHGDTVIDGKLCKKIYQDDLSNYAFSMYEENRSVYCFYNNKMNLLYDFNLKEGDQFNEWNLVVESVDTIEVCGHHFRRLILNDHNPYNATRETWVEGIGGIQNIILPVYTTGNTSSFSYCELNGDTIATKKVFANLLSGIQLPQKRANRSTINDLQGRRVTKPQKGIYIRNGKKVVVE